MVHSLPEERAIDDIKRNTALFIPSERIQQLLALTANSFEPVERYIWPGYQADNELLTAVDYSNILNKPELRNAVRRVLENQNRYSDTEISFLLIRYMISVIWKLDVLFLTHLRPCFLLNARWNAGLVYFTQNVLTKEDFNPNLLPYWLRNTSLTYAASLPADLYEQYAQLEVIPIKNTDIQARCMHLGKHYIVALDCGLYTYLQDWCRILIQGYRLWQYSTENEWAIREPVKTSAFLMILIVDIMRGNGSVFQLPPPVMNFSQNDTTVVREIVESQISFLLGHEFGHFICHRETKCPDDVLMEIEADNFSINTLRNLKCTPGILNKTDYSKQLPFEKNDIQSNDNFIRRIEAIDILFSFYEQYYYVCQKRGYLHPTSMPYLELSKSIYRRRNNIRNQLPSDYQSPFLTYVNDLAYRIQEQMNIMLN